MATHTSLKDYIGIAPESDFELTRSIEDGLPTDNLNLLRERGLTFSEMAQVIAPRTLKHRKARGESLTPVETERAVRFASTIALAERVFGNSDKAMGWLRCPNNRLSGRTPLSMLQNEAGGRVIQSMLWGIDDGIFS